MGGLGGVASGSLKKETTPGAHGWSAKLSSLVPETGLLIVALSVLDGADGAEEPILLVIDAGSEVQAGCRTRAGAVSEGESPQAIDDQGLVVRALQLAFEGAFQGIAFRTSIRVSHFTLFSPT